MLLLLIAMFDSSSAMAQALCSGGEKAVYDAVEKSFQQGYGPTAPQQVSAVDVGEAKLNYLQAQLACKEISKDRFCKDALGAATGNLATATNQMLGGLKSPIELIHYQKELRQVKAYCK
jgi:hypothetical protein